MPAKNPRRRTRKNPNESSLPRARPAGNSASSFLPREQEGEAPEGVGGGDRGGGEREGGEWGVRWRRRPAQGAGGAGRGQRVEVRRRPWPRVRPVVGRVTTLNNAAGAMSSGCPGWRCCRGEILRRVRCPRPGKIRCGSGVRWSVEANSLGSGGAEAVCGGVWRQAADFPSRHTYKHTYKMQAQARRASCLVLLGAGEVVVVRCVCANRYWIINDFYSISYLRGDIAFGHASSSSHVVGCLLDK